MAVFRSPSLLLLSLLKQADASPPDFLCPCEADVELDTTLDASASTSTRRTPTRPHRTLNRRTPSSSVVVDQPAPAVLVRRQRRVYDPDRFPRQYVRGPDGLYTLATQYSFHGQDVTCSLQDPDARAPTNIDLSSNNGGDTYDPEETQAPVTPQTDTAYPSDMPKGWPMSGKTYPDKRVAISSAILAAVIAAFIFGLIFWRRPLSRRRAHRAEKLRKLHFLPDDGDSAGALEKGIPGRDEDPDIRRTVQSRKRAIAQRLSQWKTKAKSKLSHVRQVRPPRPAAVSASASISTSARVSVRSATSSPASSTTSLPSSRAPSRPSSPAPAHSIPPDGTRDRRPSTSSSSSSPPVAVSIAVAVARRTAPSPSPTPPPPPSPPPPPLSPHQYASDPPPPDEPASASPDHHQHDTTTTADAHALDPDADADSEAEGVVRPSPPAYRRSYSDQARPSAAGAGAPEIQTDRKLPPPPPSRSASPVPGAGVGVGVAAGAEDEDVYVEDLGVTSRDRARVVPDSDRNVSAVLPRADDTMHTTHPPPHPHTQRRYVAHVATDDKAVLAGMAGMASEPGEGLQVDPSAPVWEDEDEFEYDLGEDIADEEDRERGTHRAPRFLPQPPPRVPQRSLFEFEFASAPSQPPASPSSSLPPSASAPSAPFVEDPDADPDEDADRVLHLPVYER